MLLLCAWGERRLSTITIQRSHQLPLDEVKQKAEQLAQNLIRRIGGKYRWQGDTVHYTYSGVKARIDCEESDVLIDIKLNFVASIFRGTIEEEVRETLDKHLV
jgi:putative polyhydroxyalkanoate system protein